MWEDKIAADPLSNWIGNLKNLAEIIAIIVGGIWAYFNYFRGRTYRPRVECNLTVNIAADRSKSFLNIVVHVKNVGLSRVRIQQRGTAVLVYSSHVQANPQQPVLSGWDPDYHVFEIFKSHSWIEPGEPISQPILVQLPHEHAFSYLVVLKLNSGKIWWTAEETVVTKENA
jgi:hypothetical protein